MEAVYTLEKDLGDWGSGGICIWLARFCLSFSLGPRVNLTALENGRCAAR